MRVLFVSKPIAPPFHDGTQCLVRDVARHLDRAQAIVMSTPQALTFDEGVELARVYPSTGGFAPSLSDNLRAFGWLFLRARADVWHFVFAPNPRTSAAGRWLRRMRRVPVVQTVASAPRKFTSVPRLLFGDVVVAQSDWTLHRISEGYERDEVPAARRARLEVIPPPVARLAERTPDAVQAVKRQLGIAPDAAVFVYPGDLETSSGAEEVAEVVGPILSELPGSVVVFAYREKTSAARGIASSLERSLPAESTRFTSELSDVLALIAGARAVLFPVDDLWGKVDLPIVLLESMSLGVPIVALDEGPLAELESVMHVARCDRWALVRAALDLARDSALRQSVIADQRAEVERRFAAPVVARAYERLYEELARPARSAG